MTLRIQSITTRGTLHGHVPNTFPMGLLASGGWFNTASIALILRTITLQSCITRSVALQSSLSSPVTLQSCLTKTITIGSCLTGESSS